MKRLILVLLLLTAADLFGHDLFLRPEVFLLDRPGTTLITMVLAESFPGKPVDWRKDKTASFLLSGPAGLSSLKDTADGNPVLKLDEEGTYVVGWSATPSYIEISGADFQEYITAEGYKNVAQMRKESGSENKPGKEQYTRFLKGFIQVGAGSDEDFKKPLGYKIELLPLANPYSLKSGADFDVQLLFEGKPLAGATVMATYDTFSTEHDAYAQRAETNADGIARFKIAKPGIWIVRANHMLPLTGDPKADWQSFWANCSFEVK